MRVKEVIDCGHKIGWRWKSVGEDGAFCAVCQRVYPIRVIRPVPVRHRVAEWLIRLAVWVDR